MNLPTVRQLECLVATMKHLNFRKAAADCSITQPALSAQVQQLEKQLGMKLFERSRRHVLPTPAGKELAARAREIIADLRDLSEYASGFKEPLTGSIRLGVIPTVAPYVLPRALRVVHRKFPHLRVLLREDQTSRLVSQLGAGELDLLLLALEADLGEVETLSIFKDPFLLAVRSDHRLANRKRVSEKDLEGEQVLLLDDGHCLRDQSLVFCDRAGARELDDFRASSLSTLVQMVAGGVGVTLLPEVSLKVEASAERRLRLIPFGTKKPSRTIGLAWRPSSSRREEFELLAAAMKG